MSLERFAKETDLTPKMAADLLAKNPGNRNLSLGAVKALAAVILRGGWMVNGQTIVVDDKGNLLDGQHRCAAVVLAKKTVRTLVARGITREAYATIDNGKARSGADVLHANGTPRARQMSAILRLVWQDTLGVLGSASPEHRPSNGDIAAQDAESPEVVDSLRYASRGRHTACAPVAFLHWATMRGNRALAEPFWESVITGEGLARKSPALKLRDTLLNNLNSRAKHKPITMLEFCLRAWVCHLAGHNVDALKGGILEHSAMRDSRGEIRIPMTAEEATPFVASTRRVNVAKARRA